MGEADRREAAATAQPRYRILSASGASIFVGDFPAGYFPLRDGGNMRGNSGVFGGAQRAFASLGPGENLDRG
jgi:hypothetical protein